MAAMPEELYACFPDAAGEMRAERKFCRHAHLGVDVVTALSGLGKVGAALTTTLLLSHYEVSAVLFVGVAGAVSRSVHQHDVVVATELMQHDFDASPLFPQYEIPGTGQSRFATDNQLTAALYAAAKAAMGRSFSAQKASRTPQLHRGLVVSGDQFVSGDAALAALRNALPEALAVEMEGAAVAQVCAAFGVPCAIVRSISDGANDNALQDFSAYLRDYAAPLSAGIVHAFLDEYAARSSG
jgi:adenosylhomocysteine nucleosidase